MFQIVFFLLLPSCDAGGGHHEDVSVKETDDISKEMYDNSFLKVVNNNIHIFGKAIVVRNDRLVATNHDFNTKESAGSIYMFNIKTLVKENRDVFNWSVEIPVDNVEESEEFGTSASSSADFIVVGAPNWHENQGRLYVTYIGSEKKDMEYNYGFLKGESDDQNFGGSVSINKYNDIIVGACSHKEEKAGSAYLFEYNKQWEKKKILSIPGLDAGARFASKVAITSDYIVIGAHRAKGKKQQIPESGAVYIYRKVGEIWNLESEPERIESREPNPYGHFGYSLSATDKGLLVVGAYNESGEEGNAYIFEFRNTSNGKKLSRSGLDEGHFGSSVAVHKNTIVVGGGRCNEDLVAWSGCLWKYNIAYQNNILKVSKVPEDHMVPDDNATRADQLGISVGVSDDILILSRYNKAPVDCNNRVCDDTDYTVEIATIVSIISLVIFLIMCRNRKR